MILVSRILYIIWGGLAFFASLCCPEMPSVHVYDELLQKSNTTLFTQSKDPKNLRICLLNIHSVTSKKQLLLHDLEIMKPDVLCLTETWLKGKSSVKFPGYLWAGRNRTNGVGGGVGIAIRKQLAFKIRPDLTKKLKDIEGIWVEIFPRDSRFGSILILCIYRPPNQVKSKYEHFWRTLSTQMKSLVENGEKIYLLGDFNSRSNLFGDEMPRSINTSYINGQYASDLMIQLDLTLVNFGIPTRISENSSILDLILTTSPELVIGWSVERTDLSDHSFVIVELGYQTMISIDVFRKVLKLPKTEKEWKPVVSALEQNAQLFLQKWKIPCISFFQTNSGWHTTVENRKSHFLDVDCEDLNADFVKFYTTVQNEFIGFKTFSALKSVRLTPRILKLRAMVKRITKLMARRSKMRDRSALGNAIYSSYNRILKQNRDSLARELKQFQSMNWYNFTKTINITRGGKLCWGAFKRSRGAPVNVIPTLKLGSEQAIGDKQKVEVLANFFTFVRTSGKPPTPETLLGGNPNVLHFVASNYDAINGPYWTIADVFHAQNPLNLLAKEWNSRSLNVYFVMQELESALKQLSSRSSPGSDTVSYNVLKRMGPNCKLCVLYLFNVSWVNGHLPRHWKLGNIVAIFKVGKGNRSDPGNYRPITLLSCLGKTFERMISNRWRKFIERAGHFKHFQFGFRKKKNSESQVVRFVESVLDVLERKGICGAVFLDLKKAYDLLWREGLLYKLWLKGYRGRILWWIADFLKERKNRVVYNAVESSYLNSNDGTPQGAVLSTILWNFFIDDIFDDLSQEMPHLFLSLFADDSAIMVECHKISEINVQLTKALAFLHTWSERNRAHFSIKKCVSMLFSRGSRKTPISVFMNGQQLKDVSRNGHRYL